VEEKAAGPQSGRELKRQETQGHAVGAAKPSATKGSLGHLCCSLTFRPVRHEEKGKQQERIFVITLSGR
jgi:hypothetical protein